MTDDSRRGPGVLFPPPLLFVGGIVLGEILGRVGPSLGLGLEAGTRTAIGAPLVVAGLALVAWGMATFRAAQTAIIPMFPASAIVQHGPYRFTRNPMYTGMSIAYIGVAVLLNCLWTILLLPAVLALLVRLVIRREEDYLERTFPVEYGEYKGRVRRWL